MHDLKTQPGDHKELGPMTNETFNPFPHHYQGYLGFLELFGI